MSFNIKWEEFLQEGSKKSHYEGSPVEPDGKTTKRKTRERHNKRKTKTTFGMTEPFSRGEKDLLRSTSISNVSEQTGVPVNSVQLVLEHFFGEFDNWCHAVNEAATGNITADTCRRMGFRTFGEFLKSIDNIKKAEKGSLFPDPK